MQTHTHTRPPTFMRFLKLVFIVIFELKTVAVLVVEGAARAMRRNGAINYMATAHLVNLSAKIGVRICMYT